MAPSADAIPWWDKAGKSGMGGVSARRAMSYLPPMSAENLLEPACAASPGQVHSAAIQVSTWGGIYLGIRMGRSWASICMGFHSACTCACREASPWDAGSKAGAGKHVAGVGASASWRAPFGQNKHPTAPPANAWLLPHTMSLHHASYCRGQGHHGRSPRRPPSATRKFTPMFLQLPRAGPSWPAIPP